MSGSSAAATPGSSAARLTTRMGQPGTWRASTTFVDGLIHHEITYWAEPFESPAWRAQWVELAERVPPD